MPDLHHPPNMERDEGLMESILSMLRPKALGHVPSIPSIGGAHISLQYPLSIDLKM